VRPCAPRAYERKIKKAKAKKAYHAVDRLEEKKPQYGLDHLVKERYPVGRLYCTVDKKLLSISSAVTTNSLWVT
jgi:hypothetical protein